MGANGRHPGTQVSSQASLLHQGLADDNVRIAENGRLAPREVVAPPVQRSQKALGLHGIVGVGIREAGGVPVHESVVLIVDTKGEGAAVGSGTAVKCEEHTI